MPGIGEQELQSILSELDRILVQRSEAPAPAAPPEPATERELTTEEKLEQLCAPKTPEPAPAPPPAPKPAAAPVLKAPEPAAPAPKPPAAPPLGTDSVPPDAAPEQIRKLALICTADAAEELAALVSYLQEIGREISQPIYLRTELVHTVDEQVQPGTIALKARLSESMAAVAIFKGFSPQRLEQIRKEFAKTRVHYHPIDADKIRERAMLIEIMTDLLLTDPRSF